MKIVTGYTGQNHITSNDIQSFNQGVLGEGNCVLNVGSKFNAAILDPTHIRLSDGEGVMQGVHFRIQRGQTEDVTIDPGTSGKNRIDIVCALYEKDSTTGVESVSATVVKGTEVSGTPTAPTIPSGDILAGDNVAFFPMYQLTYTELNVAVTKLFTIYGEEEERSSADAYVSRDYVDAPLYGYSYSSFVDGEYISLAPGHIYIFTLSARASSQSATAADPMGMIFSLRDSSQQTFIDGRTIYMYESSTSFGDTIISVIDTREDTDTRMVYGRAQSTGNGPAGSEIDAVIDLSYVRL